MYAWVTGLTLVAAFYDLLRTLPDHLRAVLHVNGLVDTVGKALPFATIGSGLDLPRDPGAGYWPDFPGRPSEEGITL